MKKFTHLITLVLLIVALFTGCGMTDQQKQCKHDWKIIEQQATQYGLDILIYCPKCKLEKRVDSSGWKEAQLDMEYQNKEEEK